MKTNAKVSRGPRSVDGAFVTLTYAPIARYEASQINTKLNATQKEIGLKKKVSGI